MSHSRRGAAQASNRLRGYYTFDLGPLSGEPFRWLAQPVELNLFDDRGNQLVVRGVTRSGGDMIRGHSLVGLADVSPRSHRFESASPAKILPVLTSPYNGRLVVDCKAQAGAAKPIEQHEQTDFEFLSYALPEAVLFDTGQKLCILPAAEGTLNVVAADLPDGPGSWDVQDVSAVAQSAAAHGLDPGERLTASVSGLDGPVAHPELAEFLEAVSRFRELVPPVKFLTTARSSEGLRLRLMRALRRQLAQAMSYRFRTSNLRITVGTRLSGLTRGPLVVAATEWQFVDGMFMEEVTAVPEPLAADWGQEWAPRAESLVLATVADGPDPLHLGRVPITCADQPSQIVWRGGRPGTPARTSRSVRRMPPAKR